MNFSQYDPYILREVVAIELRALDAVAAGFGLRRKPVDTLLQQRVVI